MFGEEDNFGYVVFEIPLGHSVEMPEKHLYI